MDAVVFDRAAFHRETVAAHGLPPSQAWVHSGLLFGWAAQRGLVAAWLRDRTPDAFEAFAQRRCTGPELLAAWDGNLLDDMFTDEGLAFVASYFGGRGRDSELGNYLEDYRATLCAGLPSDYHVADTWENYDRLARVLDDRWRRFVARYDPAEPRLDLRTREVATSFTGPAWLPSLTMPETIVLPQATIGLVAVSPETRRAAASPQGFVLWDPDLPVGVLADVVQRNVEGASERLLVRIVARVRGGENPAGTPPFDADRWVERVPDPPWAAEQEGFMGEIRARIGDLVAQRRAAGQAPSTLALALAMPSLAMLDAVAGDRLTTRKDRARMLRASSADDRVHLVLRALRKASGE